MAAARHLGVVHKIVISLEDMPRRIKSYDFPRQGRMTGWNRNLADTIWVVLPAAVHQTEVFIVFVTR
jgi:hypothetical protein